MGKRSSKHTTDRHRSSTFRNKKSRAKQDSENTEYDKQKKKLIK
jgi:hypothetical protein